MLAHRCTAGAPALTGSSVCLVRSRRAVRRPHIAPVAISRVTAHAGLDALGTWRDDAPVKEFVSDKPELQEVLLLHEQCLQAFDDVARASGGQLRPQPTRHAPSSKLETKSLDGNNSYILRTFSGGPISHLTATLGVVPAVGLVYAKITAHAAMQFGTPFLNIEMTSLHKKGVLVCALPDPRLYWLLHPEYLMKYWRTPVDVAPRSHWRLNSSSGRSSDSMHDAAEALSFEQLERRVRSRMLVPTGFSAPPPPPPGSPPPPPPLYESFHSASLYTRLAAAFGVLFTFDPANAQALEAARDGVHAVGIII